MCIICHDATSVSTARKNFTNSTILFVGSRDPPDKNLIVLRNLPKNIEHLPQFLTFCAWWAISHNNLFLDSKYLALFEWDTMVHNDNFWGNVTDALQDSSLDAIGLFPNELRFLWSPRDVSLQIDSIIRNLNLPFPKTDPWFATSNAILSRRKLDQFVALYETQIEILKDDKKCKWTHERIYGIWLKTQSVKAIYGLTHFQAESHGKYTQKNHFFTFLFVIVIVATYACYKYTQ